jgi:glycine cleavage system T protein (aminomethyltransferase)
MLKVTPLHSYHAAHAKLTEFAGYEMPLWYTSTSAEHMAVREGSGIFDVSHMGRFEVSGPRSTAFLEGLLPTQVQQQPPAKAFYTLLLNDDGGIIDDLIVMKFTPERYLLVVNAANSRVDMDQLQAHAPASGLSIVDVTSSTAMIAVQGPAAQSSLQELAQLDLSQLKRFRCAETTVSEQASVVSRTGYTGEDGFEVILRGPSVENPDAALRVWNKLAASSAPCGLSARDSLRLEAGLPLHGSDIDQKTDPFQADLAWVISAGKGGYVGSAALDLLRTQAPPFVRRGLVLDEGIPRHGFEVFNGSGRSGTVTSGTFSPILRKGVAQCRIKHEDSEYGTPVAVRVRDISQPGRIVKPPFYDESLYGWKRTRKGN